MTWHLKDRDLEEMLIELYPNFLDDLRFAVLSKGLRHYVQIECTRVRGNGDIPGDTISFWFDELEEISGYDPNTWNPYPEVTPPEGIPMRVETDRFRDCAIFKDGYWQSELFGEPNGRFQAEVECFRPWDD